jgi:hypothetical protein
MQTGAPSATIRSVFLFTDGQPTYGVGTLTGMKHAMSNLLAAYARYPVPVRIHTFGFGLDHDANLLQVRFCPLATRCVVNVVMKIQLLT